MALTAEERSAFVADGLTDDEIANIEEANSEEESGELGEASKEFDPDDPDMQPRVTNIHDDDDDDEPDDDELAAKVDDAAKKDDDTPKEESEEEAAELKSTRTPLLKVEMPEDWQEQRDSLETKRDALAEQFDDGDLETKEYNRQLREIDSEINKLETIKNNHEISVQMEENTARQTWIDTATAFLNEPENRIFQQSNSRILYSTLNNEVIHIANQKENEGMTGRQILEKAAENVRADLNLGSAPEKPTGKDAKPIKKTETVPTIGKMPASAVSQADEGNPFRKIDDMDPVQREEALARLSSADYDRYMNYSG